MDVPNEQSEADSLDAYLRGDFLDEKREIAETPDLLDKVLKGFASAVEKLHSGLAKGVDRKGWPYALAEDRQGTKTFSQSTNAMILFAIAALAGPERESPLLAAAAGGYRLPSDLRKVSSAVFQSLLAELVAGKSNTMSGTFGENDPFTLGWVLELFGRDVPAFLLEGKPQKNLADTVRSIQKEARSKVAAVYRDPTRPVLRVEDQGRRQEPKHTFPLLRVVQLADAVGTEHDAAKLEDRFRTSLFHRLSAEPTGDDAFDAGDLAFALEGLLRCAPDSVDPELADRVFKALAARQSVSAHWRPTHPFVITDQGAAVLPLSVEIALSLMRSSTLLAKRTVRRKTLFSSHVRMFRRYAQWIGLRMRHVPIAPGEEFTGWVSEHIDAPGLIHLWQTSQVLIFLSQYSKLLQLHITAATRRLARFEPRTFGMPKLVDHEKWSEARKPKDKWQAIADEWETVRSPALQEYAIYGQVRGALFDAPNKSILLYGPPGTGKSTIVEHVAAATRAKFIKITPSDFIAGGEAEVEKRAKDIFTVLREQQDVIVLFDEIDHLLLDRDSNMYRRQGSLFQLMVPGMLPKLEELRRRDGGPLFVIATNYEDRIDPAIKRAGRIDRRILVLPPDLDGRNYIISRELLDGKAPPRGLPGKIAALARETALFVAKEILDLLSDAKAKSVSKDPEAVLDQAQSLLSAKFRPQIRLRAYRQRFGPSARQKPIDEFVMLAFLLNQAGRTEDQDLVKQIVEGLDADERNAANRPSEVKRWFHENFNPTNQGV